MEQNKNDWQRYLESFIQEVKDFKEMSEIEFFMEYCVWTFWCELEDIKKEYSNYLSLQKENEEDLEDILNYEEWLEKVYYEENEEKINERIYEYRSWYLECIYYESKDNNYSIYEITLACGWPNIYLTLWSRWDDAIYDFNWWWERLREDLSYIYDDIFDYLNLEVYY